jgi:hypothetical protein
LNVQPDKITSTIYPPVPWTNSDAGMRIVGIIRYRKGFVFPWFNRSLSRLPWIWSRHHGPGYKFVDVDVLASTNPAVGTKVRIFNGAINRCRTAKNLLLYLGYRYKTPLLESALKEGLCEEQTGL